MVWFLRQPVLITLSKLSHETSRYESSEMYAKAALKMTKKMGNLSSYSTICWCQICEAKRMLTANDTSFLKNFNYVDSLLIFLLFITTSIRMNLKHKQINYEIYTNKSVSEIIASNESIEHRIRFLALFQTISKPIIDSKVFFISSLVKEFLITKWEAIQKESYYKGYTQGIANSLKYITRIKKDLNLQVEAEHVYELTTSYTGKTLSIRNRVEYYFEKGEFEKSKDYYCEVFKYGVKSGNRLNAIKGILGVAKCNKYLRISPLLNTRQIDELENLMSQVEGKNWRKYFRKVLAEIEKTRNQNNGS